MNAAFAVNVLRLQFHRSTQPLQKMDTLPTELHALICQKACADYGSTIRSLNSVSKYFHEVSPGRIYITESLAFGTWTSFGIIGEARTDAASTARDPPLISVRCIARHIFNPKKRLTDRETQALTRHYNTRRADSSLNRSRRALAIFAAQRSSRRVWRTSFPRLQRLALSGFYPFPSALGRFPSLTHLHLDGNRNPHGLLQMGALEDACPVLAELTITGLGRGRRVRRRARGGTYGG